jgi:hypothetical protein
MKGFVGDIEEMTEDNSDFRRVLSTAHQMRVNGAASRSRSNQGVIKVWTTTLNQNDEAVQVQIANLIVPRRQSAEVG